MKFAAAFITIFSLSILTTPPSMAAGTASSSLTNFAIQLDDLEPTDGVTPWVELGAFGKDFAYARVSLYDPISGPYQWIETRGANGFVAMAGSNSTHSTSAAWSFSSTGTVESFELHANGLALSPISSTATNMANFQIWLSAGDAQGGNGALRLSPHTSLTITAVANVSAQIDALFAQTTADGGFYYSTAGVGLYLSAPNPDGDTSNPQGSSPIAVANAVSSFEGGVLNGVIDSVSDLLLVAKIVNNTNAEMDGTFMAIINAAATQSVTSVPEPDAWFLMVIGISFLALTLSRQERLRW